MTAWPALSAELSREPGGGGLGQGSSRREASGGLLLAGEVVRHPGEELRFDAAGAAMPSVRLGQRPGQGAGVLGRRVLVRFPVQHQDGGRGRVARHSVGVRSEVRPVGSATSIVVPRVGRPREPLGQRDPGSGAGEAFTSTTAASGTSPRMSTACARAPPAENPSNATARGVASARSVTAATTAGSSSTA